MVKVQCVIEKGRQSSGRKRVLVYLRNFVQGLEPPPGRLGPLPSLLVAQPDVPLKDLASRSFNDNS